MSTLQLNQLGAFDAGGVTEAALRALVSDLYFESNVTPRVHVNDPFGPVSPSMVGRWVQPQVTLVSRQLGEKVIAPWGRPNPATFPTLMLTALLGAGVVGYFAWKGLRG
jgi:hypothetical protein